VIKAWLQQMSLFTDLWSYMHIFVKIFLGQVQSKIDELILLIHLNLLINIIYHLHIAKLPFKPAVKIDIPISTVQNQPHSHILIKHLKFLSTL
jgi:hypothetical protein